jgi:hypothetical protein
MDCRATGKKSPYVRNSNEQSQSWEAASHLLYQAILPTTNAHYCVHKTPPLDHIQSISVQSKRLSYSVCISHIPHALYMLQPSHPPRLGHPIISCLVKCTTCSNDRNHTRRSHMFFSLLFVSYIQNHFSISNLPPPTTAATTNSTALYIWERSIEHTSCPKFHDQFSICARSRDGSMVAISKLG